MYLSTVEVASLKRAATLNRRAKELIKEASAISSPILYSLLKAGSWSDEDYAHLIEALPEGFVKTEFMQWYTNNY